MQYEPIIGLEIHVQPRTKTKMFCGCANVDISAQPNTAICPVCLGHPGTLPVLNRQAVLLGIRAATALEMTINPTSAFDRKSYYYPDLPKGYQISQFDKPLAEAGKLVVTTTDSTQTIGIERLHLEEDAAKNTHTNDYSLIDYNRGGTPLMEIVTQPDIRSSEVAKVFLQELRMILRYCNISDADMEKGQLRCDVNISLRPEGTTTLHPKTEIKNVNSFKAVQQAIEYEIKRQTTAWEAGTPPAFQSTRGWDEQKQETVAQRTKENASDYRYFREPDLGPLQLEPADITQATTNMPDLPNTYRLVLRDVYDFSYAQIQHILQEQQKALFVTSLAQQLTTSIQATQPDFDNPEELRKKVKKLIAGWVLSKLDTLITSRDLCYAKLPFNVDIFHDFLLQIITRRITAATAEVVLPHLLDQTTPDLESLIEQHTTNPINTTDITQWVHEVLTTHTQQVIEYKNGKAPVFNFLLGMVMKRAKGAADPERIRAELERQLTT